MPVLWILGTVGCLASSPPLPSPPLTSSERLVASVAEGTLVLSAEGGVRCAAVVLSDRYAATAAHCVDAGGTVRLEDYFGRLAEAEVVSLDEAADVALLRSQRVVGRALRLADAPPARGARVVLVGHPIGMTWTVTDGMAVAVRVGGGPISGVWLQASVPVAPGNSGGPLVDAGGRVVGIASFTATSYRWLSGFAPSFAIRRLLAGATGVGSNEVPVSWLVESKPVLRFEASPAPTNFSTILELGR